MEIWPFYSLDPEEGTVATHAPLCNTLYNYPCVASDEGKEIAKTLYEKCKSF